MATLFFPHGSWQLTESKENQPMWRESVNFKECVQKEQVQSSTNDALAMTSLLDYSDDDHM